jgi:DNA-binding Lrp family transcriptional regulator
MSDVHFKLMRLLEANPEMSQRDLARELGVSLGKVNYCLQALIKKGWIKA